MGCAASGAPLDTGRPPAARNLTSDVRRMNSVPRKMQAEIRLVERLLREWDPTGVIPDLIADGLPANEYDDYAPYIVGMLERGCTAAELARHLEYCRISAMGLAPDAAADRQTAEKLVALWKQST